MLAGVAGWDDYDVEEFLKTGERIYALERMFNKREGFGRKDDTLPERLIKIARCATTHAIEPRLIRMR